VRLRCRHKMSKTAFSKDGPDNEELARKKSSTFSACSSSSRAWSWRMSSDFSRSSSDTMTKEGCEGWTRGDKGSEVNQAGGQEGEEQGATED
jgi:hypothetical protein